MKKYSLLTVLITLITFLGGCEKFLEEDPEVLLTQESFYKNVEDLKAAVNGIYVPLYDERASMPGCARSYQMHIAADDVTTQKTTKTQWIAIDRFNPTPVTIFIELSGWKLPYKIIKQCNNIIEVQDQIEGDPEEIKKYVALAYFWRGWAHFYASRFYNDIPIVTSTQVDLEAKRDPVLQVYQQVESDLLKALESLPDSWPSETNYPDAYALKTLLADFYITWAGWPIKDDSKYAIAAGYAEDVMLNSGASLFEDFADLWRYDDVGTFDNNQESIWEIVFSTNVEIGSNDRARPIGRNFVQKEERQGFADFFAEIGFFNRFPDSYRKEVTFKTELIDGGDTIPWQESLLEHPYYKKFRGSYDFQDSRNAQSGANFQIYRYADVLLLYAEAKAMSSGPDAPAYEAVNKVRRRANKLPIDTPDASVDLQPGLGVLEFRDAVIDERAWEFAAEQRRWYDLVRTEKVEFAASTKDSNDIQPAVQPGKNNYLFPVPFTEILLNPNLEQNPGY